MLRSTSRAARLALALVTISALGACADDTDSPTSPAVPRRPNALVAGDVVTVTNASGGTDVGSIRWATATTWTDGVIIRFDPALDGATITVDSTIVVNASVIIEAPKTKGITLSGGDRVRVMYLGESATLRNLTITHGYHPTSGGGIYARNGVTLENSTVSFNTAPTGAGIYAFSAGLTNSTVARNTGSSAGSGIYYHSDTYTGGALSLYNSTIAQNGPAAGIEHYGIVTANGGTLLNNSIVANNGVPTRNCASLINVTYEGNNLSDDATCGSVDQMLVADAKLGTLADHGGPAATIDFAPQSPALDAGVGCFTTVDERYVARDAKCDLGAFEFTDFTTVTITIDPNATVNATNGAATVTGTIKCSRAGDQFGVFVELKEEKGTKLVQGSGGAGVSCTTTAKPWSAVVTSEIGAFDAGSGAATARTNDIANWVKPAQASRTVKLARARK